MNLKNYTTEVTAEKSITAIEKLLVGFGATNIMKEYGPTANVAAISFIIVVNNMKMPFRLPAKVKNVFVWLKKKNPMRTDKTILAQAVRIVWKQMHEWVHLQLSMIEIEQVETLEALFPYLYDVQKMETYYDRVKAGGYKALLPAAI